LVWDGWVRGVVAVSQADAERAVSVSDARHSDHRRFWVLSAIVLVGIAIRVAFLGEPMRYDEAYTFDAYAIHSIRYIVSTYPYPNNQIFSTLLTHLAWKLFGNHLWTVRFSADVAGPAIVPASYAVANELYDARAGLWAAALTAVSAPLIDYSVDGRGYALGALLILVLLWIAARVLARDRWLLWGCFSVCAALALYTIPTMAYGVATVAVWLAANAVLRAELRTWRFFGRLLCSLLIAAGLALILYIPVLGQPGWTFIKPLSPTWANLSQLSTSTWDNWNRAWPHPLDWLVALGFLLSLLVHRRTARHPVPVALAALLALVGIAVAVPISPFVRSWLYLVPLYLITAGAGFAWLFAELGGHIEHRRLRWILQATGSLLVLGCLGLGVISHGQRGAEQAPSTDNHMVALIRTRGAAHEQVDLDGGLIFYPALYYFQRYHYTPPLFARPPRFARKPGTRLPNRLLVLMVRPATSGSVLAFLTAQGVETGRCRITLIKRMQFISAYEVTRD